MFTKFNYIGSVKFAFLKDIFPAIYNVCSDRHETTITLYVNMETEFSDIVNSIRNFLPSIQTGVHIHYKGWYVSKLLKESVFLASNPNYDIIVAYIDPLFSELNRRLFIKNILSRHINQILYEKGFIPFHAASVFDKRNKSGVLIVGDSGSGKSTFCMEAVLSGEYQLVSDDKSVISKETNIVYGSNTLRLNANIIDKYSSMIIKKSYCGNTLAGEKYDIELSSKYYAEKTGIQSVVVLHLQSEMNTSEQDFLKKELSSSQKDILVINDARLIADQIEYILGRDCYHITRTEGESCFEQYQKIKNS